MSLCPEQTADNAICHTLEKNQLQKLGLNPFVHTIDPKSMSMHSTVITVGPESHIVPTQSLE